MLKVHRGLRDRLVLRVTWAFKDRRVQLVQRVVSVRWGLRGILAQKDQRDPKACRGFRGLPVRRAPRVLLVQRVPKGPRESKVYRGLRVQRGLLDLRGQLVLGETTAHRSQLPVVCRTPQPYQQV